MTGYNHNRHLAGSEGGVGGQFASGDTARDEAGQVLGSLAQAEATGDEAGVMVAKAHLQEVTIKALAERDRDIPLIRNGEEGWVVDWDKYEETYGWDFEDDDDSDDIQGSVSLLSDEEVSGIGTPFEYEPEYNYYGDRTAIHQRTTLTNERLRLRAANEGWATAPEQDALFEVETPEYIPTVQKRNIADRDPGEDVGYGYRWNHEAGEMEHRSFMVGDFTEVNEGVYSTDDGRYVMLDPWREQTLDANTLSSAAAVGGQVYHSSGLDEHLPFKPGSKEDQAMLAKWERGHYAETPSLNRYRRAILAIPGGEREESVESMIRNNRIHLDAMDHAASQEPEHYEPSSDKAPWTGATMVQEKGGGYTGYQLDAAANERVPEDFRVESGLYTGVRAYAVEAMFHSDPDEARNAMSLLDEHSDPDDNERRFN